MTLVQIETGRYPTSAIRTAAASVTRDADTLTYIAGLVPAALLSARAGFDQCSPVFASTDLASGDQFWLLSLGGTSNGIRIYHDGTDVRIEALASGIVKARSAALTFARHALLGSVRWDPSAGIVYVGGNPGSTGTAWAWASAALRVGGAHSAAYEADCRLGTLGSW